MIPNLNKWHFTKLHRKKRIINLGKGNKGKRLSLYRNGISFKENKVLTISQIDSVKKFINKKLKGKSKNKYKSQKNINMKRKKKEKNAKERTILIRKNINLGLTKKPLQVRMGKGKGSPVDWVYPIARNRVFIEFISKKYKYSKLFRVFKKAENKLPTKIRYIKSKEKRKNTFTFYKLRKCVPVQL